MTYLPICRRLPGPPLTEKERNILSVLPLLHDHLDLISRVRGCLDGVTEREPGPYSPPRENEDERWVHRERRNRRLYRLEALARSLERLNQSNRLWAKRVVNAVYCVFLEPFGLHEPKDQLRLARAGLAYLAREIPGDVPAYEPLFSERGERRRQRRQELRRLLEAGLSQRQVARQVSCSTATVQAVKNGCGIKHGCLNQQRLSKAA